MSIAATARERVSDILTRTIFDNPVVTKEFRTRMRGWKAFLVMGAYCLIMSAVLIIAYYFMAQDYSAGPMNPSPYSNSRVSIGRDLFVVLAWAQTILLTLIAPGLSAGSLTQELERKTIEMLALSPLTSGRLVVGKQLADFVYTIILLASSVPLAGITLMLGGISPAEILVTYLLMVAWAFLLTSLGTMLSSLCKKTPIASLTSFGLSIFYLIYASIAGATLMMMNIYGGYRTAHAGLHPLMLLSPAIGAYGALESTLVCGIRVPLALACFVLNMAYGILFLLIASAHVLYKPAERARPIRLMLLGIWVYTAWLGHGCSAAQTSKQSLCFFGVWFLVQMVIASFFFSTGVIKRPAGKSMLGYAFSWRKIFKSDVGGAVLFMLLWITLDFAAAALATYFNAKNQMLPVQHGYWVAYFRVGISILAVIAGMTGVGVLASSLVKTRGGAAALVILFAVVAFAGYGVIASYYAFWRSMGHIHPNPWLLHLAALWPVTPLLAATGEFSKQDAPSWIRNAWIVTSLIYVFIGFVSLLLAGKAHAKIGGVREE